MIEVTHPDQLEQKGYVLSAQLTHQDMVTFIKPAMDLNNIYTNAYKLMLFGFLGVAGYYVGYTVAEGAWSWLILSHFLYGLGFVLLLIPIHEGIHGMAYKYVGAPTVSYGAVWKQMVFYAIADRFVIGYEKFRIVALAPFLVISVALTVSVFVLPAYWSVTAFSVLFFHSTFCGGDFALLGYMLAHRKEGMVTYDEQDTGLTFFYKKSAVDI